VSGTSLSTGAWLAFAQLAGPVLLAMLIIGLGAGILQTATQVREASIPFVLKLGGLAMLTIAAGNFMLRGVEDYATHLITNIPRLLHG
jgi:flagellar biosynthetic protein FliQ